MKRARDFLGALVLLVLSFPLLLLIALAVKVASGGPVIFAQRRVGFQGRTFLILKFRTMTAEQVTSVGCFLRSTHLDELPQLVNVLRGEMSLVGPRPYPVEWERIHVAHHPFYPLRRQVRPGITGPVQVRGRRWMQANLDQATKLDAEYAVGCRNKTDLQILIETCLAVWRRQGI